MWLLATNSATKNHTFQNNKLQLHGIKLLKFSSLTRNSLSQLAELRERERERERVAYQNGVFKEKNDKEISPALKRFFPSARQSAFDSFICESKSDLAYIYLWTEFTSRNTVSIAVHCTVGPYFNWVVQLLP